MAAEAVGRGPDEAAERAVHAEDVCGEERQDGDLDSLRHPAQGEVRADCEVGPDRDGGESGKADRAAAS